MCSVHKDECAYEKAINDLLEMFDSDFKEE